MLHLYVLHLMRTVGYPDVPYIILIQLTNG